MAMMNESFLDLMLILGVFLSPDVIGVTFSRIHRDNYQEKEKETTKMPVTNRRTYFEKCRSIFKRGCRRVVSISLKLCRHEKIFRIWFSKTYLVIFRLTIKRKNLISLLKTSSLKTHNSI